jgi:hypothetical protein
MKYKSRVFTLVLVLFAFVIGVSCGARDKYDELKSTITEVENNADKLSPEDWEKYDKEIEQAKERLKTERDNYTPEETERMNKLIGKYYALKAKHRARNLKQDLKDATQQLEGMFEALLEKDSL